MGVQGAAVERVRQLVDEGVTVQLTQNLVANRWQFVKYVGDGVLIQGLGRFGAWWADVEVVAGNNIADLGARFDAECLPDGRRQ